MLEFLIGFFLLFKITQQHGRLEDPPARNCAWRFGFNTPHNYDDNALNCGGFFEQWTNNGYLILKIS